MLLLQAVPLTHMYLPDPCYLCVLLGPQGLFLLFLHLREPLLLVTGNAPLIAELVGAFQQGCLGALLSRVHALPGALLLLSESCPLLGMGTLEQLRVCLLLLLTLLCMLLLEDLLGLGVCEGDAQGAGVGAYGHPTERGGEGVGQGAKGEDARLAEIEVLTCRFGKGEHGNFEGHHCILRARP
jgi:hypothetical protein